MIHFLKCSEHSLRNKSVIFIERKTVDENHSTVLLVSTVCTQPPSIPMIIYFRSSSTTNDLRNVFVYICISMFSRLEPELLMITAKV